MANESASRQEAVRPPLGEIGQIAFVTSDIQRSMRHLAMMLGIGPWFFEPRIGFKRCSYLGQPTDMTIAVGLANNGPMQYELIEQNDTHPSVYSDLIRRNPTSECFQHVCIWADDYEESLREAKSRGYEVVQEMLSGFGEAVYLAHPAIQNIVLEIAENNEGRARLRQRVAEASVGWDGSDLIRHGFPLG